MVQRIGLPTQGTTACRAAVGLGITLLSCGLGGCQTPGGSGTSYSAPPSATVPYGSSGTGTITPHPWQPDGTLTPEPEPRYTPGAVQDSGGEPIRTGGTSNPLSRFREKLPKFSSPKLPGQPLSHLPWSNRVANAPADGGDQNLGGGMGDAGGTARTLPRLEPRQPVALGAPRDAQDESHGHTPPMSALREEDDPFLVRRRQLEQAPGSDTNQGESALPRTAEAPSWTARGGTPLPPAADLNADDAELNLDSQLPPPVPMPLELPPPSSSPPAAAIPRPLDLTPTKLNQTSVPWTGQESSYTIPRRSAGSASTSSPNSGPALLPTTSSDTNTPRQFRR